MSDLDDLGFTSITDISQEEALERLRQIRLARRSPVNSTRNKSNVVKQPKVQINPELAAELLKLLGKD